jgi:uncharacterized protein (TIGR02271 family)
MLATKNLRDLIGSTLFGADEQKIGTVADIYMDDETGEPEWLLVNTGWFGSRQSFVPISAAQRRGEDLVVPYGKEEVKGAPTTEADGHLDQAEEATLYRHYNMDGTAGIRRDSREQPRQGRSDDAMTRSEEEVRVGTTTQETGRPRLRKWIETERVTETVPVSREEVRVVREPITGENVDRATSGPDLTENVHEVVLHEERPVVAKETVPKERIRLEKQTVTEERTVEADVRKERIGFEEGTQR